MSEKRSQSGFVALIPFFVFAVFYLGLSIWAKDFYKVPMPIAFLVASASAMLMNWKQPLSEKVDVYAKGMGEMNIMIMCLIFILSGAFATVAKGMGAVEAAVLLSRHLIPNDFMLLGIFLVSCFISLAIGTSCGTIATITPIACGLIESMGISPELMLGAVVGGAMFGDNMSMISDTTIAATRTQNVAMRDKFIANFLMVLPAAIVCIIVYVCAGKQCTVAPGELADIELKHCLAIIPYLLVLLLALFGFNVMALLFFGTVLAMVIGIFNGSFDFMAALSKSGEGTLGMAETLIVAILAGGLLGLIRHNGGIDYILEKIQSKISGQRGCECGIVLLVAVVNLFTANNTVAIVIAGPIAHNISEKFHCQGKRIASLLDTTSCVVQGLIPYGAQILIATGVAKTSGLQISAQALGMRLYYPMLMLVCLLVSIFIAKRSKTSEVAA